MIGRIGLILWINPACGTAWWKQLRLDSSTARRPVQRNSERETTGPRSPRVRAAGRMGPHAVRVRIGSRARSPRGPTIATRASLNVPDCRRTTGPFASASGACGGPKLPCRPLQPPRRRNGGGQPLREVRGLHHRRELARSRLVLRLEDRDSVLEGGERRARELRSHARRSGRPRVALGDAPLRLLDDPHRDGARGRPRPHAREADPGGECIPDHLHPASHGLPGGGGAHLAVPLRRAGRLDQPLPRALVRVRAASSSPSSSGGFAPTRSRAGPLVPRSSVLSRSGQFEEGARARSVRWIAARWRVP